MDYLAKEVDMSLEESRRNRECGSSGSPVWGGELGRLCNSFMVFDELYGRFAKTYGESYFSLWTLEEIGDSSEGITQKQMASLLHLPKQTMSSIVASLVKRGLVETKPSPTDGRSKVHTLTEAGRALYERERADLACINEEVTQTLGRERVAAMNDVFEEMNVELAQAFERLAKEDVDGSATSKKSTCKEAHSASIGTETGLTHEESGVNGD